MRRNTFSFSGVDLESANPIPHIQKFATKTYHDVIVKDRFNIISDTVIPQDYEETEAMNDRRRKLLKRSNLTGLRIILNWKYTLLVSVFFDSQLYLSMGVYSLARYFRGTAFNTVQASTFTAVAVLSNLFSFLLVFYLTQSYTRFSAQYDLAMSIEGRIFDSLLLARACMTPEGAWRLYRYMNAIHLLGYSCLGDTYNEKNLFYPLNIKYGLLNDSEVYRIKNIGFKGGSAYREVLAWMIEGIKSEQTRGIINSIEMDTLVGQAFQLRAKIGSLYDYADQPLPYSYIHFINFMVFFYLPIFAYFVACAYASGDASNPQATHDSILGALIVFLYCSVTLALRTLAQHLQEPFGNFEEDLSVLHYVRFTIVASRRVLCALNVAPPCVDDEMILTEIREASLADNNIKYKDMHTFRTAKNEYFESDRDRRDTIAHGDELASRYFLPEQKSREFFETPSAATTAFVPSLAIMPTISEQTSSRLGSSGAGSSASSVVIDV